MRCVVVSAGHVGGTRIMSSAANVLWMSVVHGMRGVGGVCEICLARGGVGVEGAEWMRGLSLGCTNPFGTGGVFDMCVFWLWWCGWRVGRGVGPGTGVVVLCLCVL